MKTLSCLVLNIQTPEHILSAQGMYYVQFTKEEIEVLNWGNLPHISQPVSGRAGFKPEPDSHQNPFLCQSPRLLLLVFSSFSEQWSKNKASGSWTKNMLLPSPLPLPQPLKGKKETGSCEISRVPSGITARNASWLDTQCLKCSEFHLLHFFSHKSHS